MAPRDIPFHWKQIEEKIENILLEEFEDEDIIDDEDHVIESTDDSDDSELEYLLVGEDCSESDSDSILYCPLHEVSEGETSTPVCAEAPEPRRRLFETSSGDEDDEDDGVAYLDD